MMVRLREQGTTMAISERPETPLPSDVSPWVGQRMTLDEFLALPEEEPALEYDEGVVTQKMAPVADHGELQAIIRDVLNEAAEEERLGRAFLEIRFTDRGVSRVPDVGFYRRERLQIRPGRRYARNLGLPDLTVEVVSPGQTVMSQMKKSLRYLELGAAIAIVVDEEEEAVLVLRPGQAPRIFQGDDRIDLDDMLPSLNLTARALFHAILPDWMDTEATTETAEDASQDEASTHPEA
jgi:Uma2 family endonuclease